MPNKGLNEKKQQIYRFLFETPKFTGIKLEEL